MRHRPITRGVAVALFAALGLWLAPRPSSASAPVGHPCHTPLSPNAVTTAEPHCGAAGHLACLAMPGCAAVSALVAPPPFSLLVAPTTRQSAPVTQVIRDLAARGPPTPPPNS